VALGLGGSSLLAFAFQPLLHDKAQLLPFTLAVIAASTFGGLVPGLITTVLAYLIGDFFFIEPRFSILSTGDDLALLGIFLIFGITVTLLNHRISKTKLALLRSNDELHHFAHSVAHDLQEPLRGIRLMTELFLIENRGGLDGKSSHLLDTVVASADRMQRLIRAILDFAAAKEAPNDEMQPVASQGVAQEALEQLQGSVEETGAIVRIDKLPRVRGHREQLVRLFQNLIANALKYHGDRVPEVDISAEVHNIKGCVFSVHDNGIGIDRRCFDKIFQPFQRLSRGTNAAGSGLGLATCKRIVEAHGGRIWVESEPGKGSTFRFTLTPEP